MSITLDSESIKDLVSQAILASLDQAKREILIGEAIKFLITPGSSYSGQKSPLQSAFSEAISQVASKMATEMLTNNETVKTKIKELITEAMIKVFETNRERTIDKLAAAITNGLSSSDR